MNKNAVEFVIKDKKIILDTGKTVTFDYLIADAVAFDDVIVVRLNSPSAEHFNENVFGVGCDGKILWQIEKKEHVYDESPYTYIGQRGNNVILFNFDGLELTIEPVTGKILKEEHIR